MPLRLWKSKLVESHVDATAAENDALAFQPDALLHPGMPAELDLASTTDHAMPGDRAMRRPQRPGDLPGVPRKPGGARYLAVCRDLALRDFPDRSEQFPENERTLTHTTGAAS